LTPSKSEIFLRSKSIKIRVSEQEKSALLARAGDMTLADFLRDLGLGRDPVPQPKKEKSRKFREPPPADPALLRELARIGNNLNQLARLSNAGTPPLDLIVQLQAIESELKELKQLHSARSGQ
jgi:hypothetical protein